METFIDITNIGPVADFIARLSNKCKILYSLQHDSIVIWTKHLFFLR